MTAWRTTISPPRHVGPHHESHNRCPPGPFSPVPVNRASTDCRISACYRRKNALSPSPTLGHLLNVSSTNSPLPPWVRGLADNLAAAKLLLDSTLESRNRLALILLDSALEIGFREYLENVKKITGLDPEDMKHREKLNKVVRRNSPITDEDWTRLDFFYQLRCDCYHESASLTMNDSLIGEFYTLVSSIIDLLFDVTISAYVPTQAEIIGKPAGPLAIPISAAATDVEEIVIALFDGPLKTTKDIVEKLKQKGSRRSMTPSNISSRMADAKYRHLFYKAADGWTLSDAGRDRFFEVFSRVQGGTE
jgi:hypothetical protein